MCPVAVPGTTLVLKLNREPSLVNAGVIQTPPPTKFYNEFASRIMNDFQG